MNNKRRTWNSRWFRVAVVLLLSFLLVATVLAASGPSIITWVIGPGGGQVEGDGLQLRSAIGQPVAGSVSEDLTLCSGFLCGQGVSGDGNHYIYLPLTLRE